MGVVDVQETLDEELDWAVGAKGPDQAVTVRDGLSCKGIRDQRYSTHRYSTTKGI